MDEVIQRMQKDKEISKIVKLHTTYIKGFVRCAGGQFKNSRGRLINDYEVQLNIEAHQAKTIKKLIDLNNKHKG